MKFLALLILSVLPFPNVFIQREGFCQNDKVLVHEDKRLGEEAYVIDVKPGGVFIKSGGPVATFYANQTLEQLREQNEGRVPVVHIEDSPRFAHRGIELDCSRHFFSIDEVKKVLDVMGRYKLNRFHWHLTDDHGWRVEIKKYPLLTQVGAYRNGTMVGWDANTNDGIRYGGFYTQDELREVVAYARERGIEIIPEIDHPAHMVSALTAYPYLGCTGGPYSLMTVWDISKDVLCPGKESSFEFLEDIFTEICDIFPYEYIHIGGDECPKVRWENCPDCQARIRELGLKDTEHAKAEQYLQNYVTVRVQEILAKMGRKVIGWDEILEGELAPGATIMSWRGTEGGIKAAATGFDVIMTPTGYCYLDYCQAEDSRQEPINIGGYVPIEKVYGYDPTDGMDSASASHILGLQGNLWTEFIAENWHLEYMLLPRLLAVAEVGWTQPSRKDYVRFYRDVTQNEFPYLAAKGYTFCREMEKPHVTKGGKAKRVIIMTFDGISIEGFKKAPTPNIDAMMARGAASLTTRDVMPSITLPNYTSHLLGAGPEIHGVADNDWCVDKYTMPALVRDSEGYFPSVFQVLKEQLPAVKTAFYHDWDKLICPYNPKYFDDTYYIKYSGKSYPLLCDRAWDFIKSNRDNPTFVFLYNVWTDESGHIHGWMSDEYIKSIEEADAEVGRMVERLKAEGMLDDTHLMFISDHGGINKGHGGMTEAEMVVPWIITGPDIKNGFEITEPNNTVNTASTVLHLFGLKKQPDCWTGEVPYSIYK